MSIRSLPGGIPEHGGLLGPEDLVRCAWDLLAGNNVYARLQFFKPGLELAKTNDESVLAKLPEDERKIAREIAQSLAEAARQPAGGPPSPAEVEEPPVS